MFISQCATKQLICEVTDKHEYQVTFSREFCTLKVFIFFSSDKHAIDTIWSVIDAKLNYIQATVRQINVSAVVLCTWLK